MEDDLLIDAVLLAEAAAQEENIETDEQKLVRWTLEIKEIKNSSELYT